MGSDSGGERKRRCQMIDISFTTFLSFEAAESHQRVTEVRRAREQYDEDYGPHADFYRRLRKSIESTFRMGKSVDDLTELLEEVNEKKQRNYELCLRGLESWAKRNRIEWIDEPVRITWSCGDLAVRVNPELSLLINGKRCLVKLYFKKDPLEKRRLNVALHLLREAALASGVDPLDVGVLDLRKGKLHRAGRPLKDIDISLQAEAHHFAFLWNLLDEDAA